MQAPRLIAMVATIFVTMGLAAAQATTAPTNASTKPALQAATTPATPPTTLPVVPPVAKPVVAAEKLPATLPSTLPAAAVSVSPLPRVSASSPATAPATQPVVRNIYFKFDNMPYNDIVRFFSQKISKKPLLGDVQVDGNLTFVDADPYSYDEAVDTLNLLLAMRGWQLVERPRFLQLERLGQNQRPRFIAAGQDPGKVRPSEVVTMIVPLKFMDAETAKNTVIRNVSQGGFLAALPKGKGLVITDKMENIDYIQALLSELDKGDLAIEQMKTSQLKRASAQGVAETITALFGPNRPRKMIFNIQHNRMVPDPSDTGDFVTAVADARTNMLFLVGSSDKVAMAQSMIEQLDADAPPESGEIQIFELKNARAEEVANNIRQLLGQQPPQMGPNRKPVAPPKVVADAGTNTIIVSASRDQMTSIEKLIKDIDSKVVASGGTKIFRLENADPQQIAPIIQAIGTRRDSQGRQISAFTVSVDPRGNALIVSGNGDTQEVAKLVTELDKKLDGKDGREIRVIQLKGGDAREMADSINKVFAQRSGKQGPNQNVGGPRVEPIPATNSLLIAAGPADWPVLQEVLDKVQANVEPMTVAVTKHVALKNAKSVDVANTLRQAYVPQQHTSRGGQQQPQQRQVSIIPNERTNSLLITATEADQAAIAQLITVLDVPIAEPGQGVSSIDPVVIIRLKSADAGKLASTLQAMLPRGSGEVAIQPDPTNSMLLVRGPETHRKMLEDLVGKLDAEITQTAREMQTVPLKGASANGLANMLNQLYNNVSSNQRGRMRGPVDPSADAIIIVPAPDDKTLIIDAPKQKLAQVVELAKSLDVDFAPSKVEVRIFELKSANANDVAPTLGRLYSDQQSRRPNQGNMPAEPQPKFEADAATNRLLVAATMHQFETISKMIEEIDTGVKDVSGAKVVKLKNADAATLAGIITAAASRRDAQGRPLPGLQVSADTRSNSLVVAGVAGDIASAMKLIETMDVDAPGGAGEVQIIKLASADAGKVAQSLQAMVPPAARGQQEVFITADAGTNSILLRAPQAQQKMLTDMIAKLDQAVQAGARVMKVHKLTGASAGALAATLTQFYQHTAGTSGTSRRPAANVDAQADAVIITAAPDDRTLLIEAPSMKMDGILELVKSLDSEFAPTRVEVRIYQLANANANELAPSLSRLFQEQQVRRLGQAAANGEPQPKFEVDSGSNRLLVAATMQQQETITKLVADLDKGNKESGGSKIVKLKHADASALANLVTNAASRRDAQGRILGGLSVSADNRTNSLVIAGSAGDVAAAMKLVESMDVASDEGSDQIQIVRLNSADANRLADLLRNMIPATQGNKPQEVYVQADASTNSVLIRAPQSQRKIIEEMIASLDKDSPEPREMRMVKLKGASANALAGMMNQFYSNLAPVAKPNRNVSPQQGPDAVIITAAPDDRTLVIDAPHRKIDAIEKLAKDLDADFVPTSMQIKTYQMTNGTAAETAGSLSRLFSEQQKKTGASSSTPEPAPRFEADNATNQLIVAATAKQFEAIDELVKKLNDKVLLAMQTKTYCLENARASDVVNVLQTMLVDNNNGGQRRPSDAANTARVAAMPDGSAVVVQGLPEKQTLAAEIIKSLDADQVGSQTIMIVPLKNAQARTLADAVNASLAQQASAPRTGKRPNEASDQIFVTPEPNSNSLLIRGPADRLPKIIDLIKQLDEGGTGTGTAVKLYTLENCEATELAAIADRFFKDLANQNRRNQGEAIPFSISADPRTNSVLVSTTTAFFTIFENIKDKLDKAPDRPARDSQYFWLVNAEPSDVASKLNSLFSDRKGADKPIIESDTYMNAVSVIAKDADIKICEPVILKMDEAAKGRNMRIRVVPLSTGLKADKMADVIKRVYGQMTDSEIVITDKLSAQKPAEMPLELGPTHNPLPNFVGDPSDAAATGPAAKPSSQPAIAATQGSEGDSGKPKITIAIDKASNSLIISGTRQDLESIQSIIEQLATTTEKDMDLRLFPVKNADPAAVARTLNDLFNPRAFSLGQPMGQPQQGQPRRGRGGQGQQPQPEDLTAMPTVQAGPPSTVTIVPDTRTRSLIVRAKPTEFDSIELIIQHLDQASQVTSEVKVFPLKNTDASEIAGNLRELFGVAGSTAARQPRGMNPMQGIPMQPGVPNDQRMEMIRQMMQMNGMEADVSKGITISANRVTNSVVVSAPTETLKLVTKLVEELDQSVVAGKITSVRLYPLKGAEVASTVSALQQLFGQRQGPRGAQNTAEAPVVITGDEPSRTILVAATAEKHDLIAKTIKELDESVGIDAASVKVYKITHADASTLASVLAATLSDGTTRTGPRIGPRTGQGTSLIRISADPISNCIVVRAGKAEHERIAKLIEEIDVLPGSQFAMQTIPLTNADAANVAAILNRLFASAGSKKGVAASNQQVRIEGDKDSRLLMVQADDETFKKIRAVVKDLDAVPGATTAVPTVAMLKHADSMTVAGILQQAFTAPRAGAGRTAAPEDVVTIVGAAFSNSIVITATPKKTQQVLELLDKIDIDSPETGFKTEFILLKNLRATDVAATLQKTLSAGAQGPVGTGRQQRTQQVSIAAEPSSNAIVYSGPAADLAKLKQLITDLEKAGETSGTDTKAIALKTAQASTVAAALQQAFSPRGRGTTGEDSVTIAAETGSNSVVVTANAVNMKKVESLIAMLDTETAGNIKSEIVILQNAKAVDLAATLQKIAANSAKAGPRTPNQGNQPQVVVAGDAGSNAILMSGPQADLDKLKAMAVQLDTVGAGTPGVYTIQLKNGDAASVAAMVKDLYSQANKGAAKTNESFGVTADERANAIVLASTKDQYEKIKEWVSGLEAMKPAKGNLRIIPLINADPADVDKAIHQMYGPGTSSGSALPTGRPSRNPSAGPGSSSSSGTGKVETTVLAQQRALLINANDEDYAEIEKLIKVLEEAAVAAKRDIKMFTLKNAANTRLAPALDAMFKQVAKANTPADLVSVQAVPQTNAIVVSATKEKMADVSRLIDELDKPENSTNVDYKIYPLANATPTKVLPILKQMLAPIQKVKPDEPIDVVADDRTKTIIVTARGTLFEQINKIMDSIDKAPAHQKADVLVYPLKHADATNLAKVLNDMLRPDTTGNATPEAKALQEQVRLLNIRGTADEKLPELDLTKPIKITPDPANTQGSNSLVVESTTDNIKTLQSLIALLDVVPVADGTVVRLVHLQNSDAMSVQAILKDIFTQGQTLAGKKGSTVSGKAEPASETGKALVNAVVISADLRTNTLIISGSESSCALAEVILKDLDRNEGKLVTEVKLFKLKNADATKLMPLLQSVFAETPAVAGSEGLRTQVTRLKTVLDKQAGHASELPKGRATLTLQADSFSNIIIVAARSDLMPLIGDVIESMDIPGAGSMNAVRIYALENSDPTRLMTMINQLYTGPNAKLIRDEDKPTLTADTRTNVLVVAASDKTFVMLDDLIKKLDVKTPIDMQDIRIVPLKNSEAATLAGTLQKMMDARVARLTTLTPKEVESLKMMIVADDRSNALIVGGSKEGFAIVESLARQLDGASPALSAQVQIHPLKNGNAGNIATSLTNLFSQRYQATTAKDVQRQKPVILADLRTNALLVSATEDDTKVLKGLLEKLDVKLTDAAVLLEVIPLQFNDAGSVGPTIKTIFAARLKAMTPTGSTPDPASTVDVSAEPLANALVVVASKENIDEIKALLKKVDIEPPSDTGLIKIIPLKNADATGAGNLLGGLIKQGLYKPALTGAANNPAIAAREKISIIADIRTNALIVSASKENMAVIDQIIKQLDSEAAVLAGDMRIYPLKKADATKLAPMLQQFFASKRAAELAVNKDLKAMTMVVVADSRTNTLLVSGAKDDFAAVEEMIKKLDTEEVVAATEFKVYYLKNATAAALQPLLNQMFAQRITRTGQTKDPITVTADPKANCLIVGASPEDMKLADSLITKLDSTEPNGQAMKVFALKQATASTVATTIKNLLTAQGTTAATGVGISFDDRTNSLIVTAGAADMERIADLVHQLDKDKLTKVKEIKVFTLANADAKELSQILTDVLTKKPTAVTPENPNLQSMIQFITSTPDGKDLLSSALQEGVLITPDARTNSIVVTAPLENIPMLSNLIKALDSTSPRAAEIRVFSLVNADAKAMGDVLTQLFRLQGAGANAATAKAVQYTLVTSQPASGKGNATATIGTAEQSALSVTVDTRTNSLLLGGTRQYVELASKIIQELDASPAQEMQSVVYRLRNARAGDVQTALQNFMTQEKQKITGDLGAGGVGSMQRILEQEVVVVAVPSEGKPENANTLLVSASPRYIGVVEDMIKELDQPPPQVLVQVLLAEVALNDELDFGMDAMWTQKIDDTTVRLGTKFKLVDEITKFNGFNVSVTGGDLTFFLRALATQGRLEVLSRPQILAADNQQAMINVGQRVPFIVNSQISDTGQVLNTIQYNPVGVILTVTPRINPDGLVKLAVAPEVSSISTSTVEVSPGVNAAIINQRTAQTTLTVQDGHTVVLGGLIMTKDELTEDKVPVLGDIPLLGVLFKKSVKTKQRSELLIILTPHVMRNIQHNDDTTKCSIDRLKSMVNRNNVDEIQRQLFPNYSGNACSPSALPASQPAKGTEFLPVTLPSGQSKDPNVIPVDIKLRKDGKVEDTVKIENLSPEAGPALDVGRTGPAAEPKVAEEEPINLDDDSAATAPEGSGGERAKPQPAKPAPAKNEPPKEGAKPPESDPVSSEDF